MLIKGQVVSGEFGRIIARQKAGQSIEIGELLVADSDDGKILMQVYDLVYGSQISQQNLETTYTLRVVPIPWTKSSGDRTSDVLGTDPIINIINLCQNRDK